MAETVFRLTEVPLYLRKWWFVCILGEGFNCTYVHGLACFYSDENWFCIKNEIMAFLSGLAVKLHY